MIFRKRFGPGLSPLPGPPWSTFVSAFPRARVMHGPLSSERGLSGSPRVPQGPSGGSVDPLKGRAMERLRVSQVPQGLFSGDGSPTFGRPYSPCMRLAPASAPELSDKSLTTRMIAYVASCLVGRHQSQLCPHSKLKDGTKSASSSRSGNRPTYALSCKSATTSPSPSNHQSFTPLEDPARDIFAIFLDLM